MIPNSWDVGSARMLQALGFPALASTWSSGRIANEGRFDAPWARPRRAPN